MLAFAYHRYRNVSHKHDTFEYRLLLRKADYLLAEFHRVIPVARHYICPESFILENLPVCLDLGFTLSVCLYVGDYGE